MPYACHSVYYPTMQCASVHVAIASHLHNRRLCKWLCSYCNMQTRITLTKGNDKSSHLHFHAIVASLQLLQERKQSLKTIALVLLIEWIPLKRMDQDQPVTWYILL